MMARSTINNSFSFSIKLAIVALVVCTLCNSNGDGSPIPKLRTSQATDSMGDPHYCTNYKALLVNVYSETPTKVVTFCGNETDFKHITRHPISVYNLYREMRFSSSVDSQLRYWKTIGDKYLAVNSNGQLILQEENSTRFLMVNATITNDRVETFYVCAFKGGKGYLVTHSKNTEPKQEWTEADCQSKTTFNAKLEEIKPDKRTKYVFNGVGIKDTNFNSLHIKIGDELKLLCDV